MSEHQENDENIEFLVDEVISLLRQRREREHERQTSLLQLMGAMLAESNDTTNDDNDDDSGTNNDNDTETLNLSMMDIINDTLAWQQQQNANGNDNVNVNINPRMDHHDPGFLHMFGGTPHYMPPTNPDLITFAGLRNLLPQQQLDSVPIPLDKEHLDAIGVAKFNSESNLKFTSCSICISDYEFGEDIRTLPCTHVFHKECIDPWFEQRPLCPLCKKDMRT